MTSISNHIAAGRATMDARISQAVTAGTVGTADQTALAPIDGALTSRSGGDVRSRIDSLISGQVSAGTLTDTQAQELQGFFAQAPGAPPPGADGSSAAQSVAGVDGTGASTATHHGHHAHGHHAPPPTDDDSSADTGTDLASTGTDVTSTASNGETKALDSLISFLDTLRANGASGGGTYGSSSGISATSSSSAGLLIDSAA